MRHVPRKRFGQHFLRDKAVLRQIVELGELTPGEEVLEIGAGDGTLTRALLASGARVTAVELDRDLVSGLWSLAEQETRLTLLEGDAMRLDPATLPSPMKVMANLPYNIATGLISWLCGSPRHFPLMVVMVQREVGTRLAAAPGSKDYGTLTIWVQYRYEVELCRLVAPGAFRPPPRVQSALMRLRVRENPFVEVPDENAYFRIVRAAFAQRRKTLRNNLRALPPPAAKETDWEEILERAEVDGGRRAETLAAEEFARIARALPPRGEER